MPMLQPRGRSIGILLGPLRKTLLCSNPAFKTASVLLRDNGFDGCSRSQYHYCHGKRSTQIASSSLSLWKKGISCHASLDRPTDFFNHKQCLNFNGPRWNRKLHRESRESILTIPNLLSTVRICATPLIGYCILTGSYTPALALTVAAGFTDLLDGYIARKFPSQASVLGSVLDPAADKILVSTLVMSLMLMNLIPVWLCILIVGRDLALIGGVSCLRFKTLSPPRTIRRFFDAGPPTVQLKPTFISKVNTLLQLSVVWCSLAAPVFDFVGSPYLIYLHYLVGSTTFITGVDYLRKSGTFRVINEEDTP